ncbi:MAG TPA: tryptophan synthase subunit alpha [Solirubrobacterales bacterium]|nr:tryptophan synthase subunit alpha [Solirubrobacterales bacterium]
MASDPAAPPVTGTQRIAAAFERAREKGRAALMPYLMGGFPSQETATAVAEAYVDAGADLVELGVPFSDPLADGPVIHAAATTALAGGATLDSVLETCAAIADRVPVVPMCYSNMVLASGPREYAERLAGAGAAGTIVPDLPPEEAAGVHEELRRRDLALVPLVAPTTPPERRRSICERAEGFVYVVSVAGVTGERAELPPELGELVVAVRAEAAVPAAVGFGVGTPEQVATVGGLADGVIVGTRLVRAVGEAGEPASAAAAVASFIRDSLAAIGNRNG